VRTERVVVVGAGIGGLVAAIELARHGLAVTVLERAATPGGKVREVEVAGRRLDAGPTVFTMRGVFEEIFADAGTSLSSEITLQPAEILARHAWSADERLDLFADVARSAEAIGAFAGLAEAQGFRAFCAHAKRVYETLDRTFIRAERPAGPMALARRVAMQGLGDLLKIDPFAKLWPALGRHFGDPRLRQLFGRYATYLGSSPFRAPATLMLIAHVEQSGVWLVEGGMHRLAVALARLAEANGVGFRYQADVSEVVTGGGRAAGVRLTTGERIEADAVVVNADAAALPAGLLGARMTGALPGTSRAGRSLSAVTWNLVARTRGFPLHRHTVFFSNDYRAEFDDLFARHRLPRAPTVYVCAHDRNGRGDSAPDAPERLLCLVNAPATGDIHDFDAQEIETCATRTFALLERAGLQIHPQPDATEVTTPRGFELLFPGTGGALYGQATHGWMASFRRPGSRTRIPGLYLAGGSTHPGAGVPMAALSGRLAASSLRDDLASTGRSRRAATPGGTSMR
jgi:1-hydroxycarotenoid 3,4-desaturase